MMKKFNRGFTLIELLVVIAIIGILSSVVLASLNTARGKGADAAVKANLNNIRAQAELVYDTNSSYANVCADNNVVKGISAAASATGATWTSTTNNVAGMACLSAAGTWVAFTPLKAAANTWWCVDSSGTAKQETAAPATSVTACP
jgi:prepilin-type N-terminal cleavage/methylation domain-containing protein